MQSASPFFCGWWPWLEDERIPWSLYHSRSDTLSNTTPAMFQSTIWGKTWRWKNTGHDCTASKIVFGGFVAMGWNYGTVCLAVEISSQCSYKLHWWPFQVGLTSVLPVMLLQFGPMKHGHQRRLHAKCSYIGWCAEISAFERSYWQRMTQVALCHCHGDKKWSMRSIAQTTLLSI